ncbi:MAG: phage tail tape measure protein, partial [Aristaeellaceae bacterium]
MASRKEYEMLFKLNSQLGSSFSGSFQKAQKELAALQRQVEALNKSQSDIKAYQKQQESISKTEEKLRLLQQQYDNIQREMQETGSYSSDLENKLLAKQQQIDRTNASLSQQKEKLEQMGASLKDAGVDTENLTKESERLAEEIQECKEQEENFGNAGAMAFDTVASAISAAGIAAALKEIYDAYMECVSIAGDFEEGMSNVEAISGATAEEMELLSGKAKELGATTKFTAQEASDAMGYMAMAGWDAQEMLSGMDGVLQLAAASGEDLAMVSDIVTDNLTAFGLTAADTARFADVLAAAATNSNTNVSIMGETFKQSAPLAGALGYSIEDVATAVGLMANAGVKGSIAGTALKNIFNGLLEGVTLTSAALGEYEFSAVKADGTMKDFRTTIDELRSCFDQMTEAEKMSNAEAIAGMRGYAGLLSILNATDDDYTRLSNSINNCTGAAREMASIKLDNMNGQLTIMKSAWDGLKISLGEQFTPVMRNLYSLGTDLFGLLNSFVQKHPALVKAVTAFIGVMATATAGILAFAAAKKIAAAINLAALFSAAAPIAAVVAGVAALTAGIVALASAANEGIPSVKELTGAAREMGKTIDDAKATYEETSASTLAAANVADTYISKLEEMGDYASLSEDEQRQYHNTLALLCQVVPELSNSIDLETNSIDGGTAALRANTEAWKQNAIQQAYQEQLTAIYSSYADVLVEAEENSIGLTKAQYELDAANQRYNDALARMDELWNEAVAEANAMYEEYGLVADATGYLSQEYYDLQNSLGDLDSDIYAAETTVNNYTEAMEKDAEAVAEAEAEIALAEEAVQNLTEAADDGSAAAEEAAASTEEVTLAIGEAREQIDALTKAYTEVYDAALESVQGQYNLWDDVEAVVATSAESINNNLQNQITYWQDYNTNLAALRERTGDIEGLNDMIASFADGSTDSVNAVAGMAAANDEELAAMVKNWQELQEEQNNVADNIAELKTN